MDPEELLDGSVCRLVKVSNSFPPDSRVPRVTDFDLSSQDKSEATKRGTEPLLSVFDEDRTTLSQAKAIYGSPEACIGFGLSIEGIRKIRIPNTPEYLRVLRDPLPEPSANLPGADGHCGIKGLHRPRGAPKADYKFLRLKLRDIAEFRG